jgi:hypothetical protein
MGGRHGFGKKSDVIPFVKLSPLSQVIYYYNKIVMVAKVKPTSFTCPREPASLF